MQEAIRTGRPYQTRLDPPPPIPAAAIRLGGIMSSNSITMFEEIVQVNLSHYSGISNNHLLIHQLALTLDSLNKNGFSKLVTRFSSQKEPEQAFDTLVEIWFCRVLQHTKACAIEYEPRVSNSPPDFRCVLGNVTFDIQIKRMRQIYNEITLEKFERECRRQLSCLPNPWLINYSLSDDFSAKDINPFLAYILSNINQFNPISVPEEFTAERHYEWKQGDKTYARFHFFLKTPPNPGIYPGFLESWSDDGGFKTIDFPRMRRALGKRLDKAKKSFPIQPSAQHANVVVIFPDWMVWLKDNLAQILYGEDCVKKPIESLQYKYFTTPKGRFFGGNYPLISGIILLPRDLELITEPFRGEYYTNPFCWQFTKDQPQLFSDMIVHFSD